jgi:hypothetical protein
MEGNHTKKIEIIMETSIRVIQTFIVLFIIAAISAHIYRYSVKNEITATVVHKEQVVESVGESITSYYLIFTDNGTFKLEDELVYLNFRSSDWYGAITVGSTYTFTVIGWRIPVFSEYQNIVAYK